MSVVSATLTSDRYNSFIRRWRYNTVKGWFVRGSSLAGSSSPRPWIAVFVLPRKSNVFQHGGDWERSRPQGTKNVHSFLMTVRNMSWACGHVIDILLIIIPIFDLIILGPVVLDMTVQRNASRFCMGSICGWNLFQPLGLVHHRLFTAK